MYSRFFNPCERVQPPKSKKPKRRYYDDEQYKVLLSNLNKLTTEDIKYKVKKMINKQNKNIVKGGKMGNRFKGKKNVSNKIDLKKI